MHNPTILVSGSSGFLGSYICNYLINSSLSYYSIGRTNCDIYCDLSLSIPTFNQKFDLVIHAAGKAHFLPKTEIDKQAFFNVNFIGTENLLNGLEDSKSIPKAFVYISSVSVYGIDSGNNIGEDQPLLAQDPYGLSKITAEELIIEWCAKRNVICTILRPPLLVGSNPPGNLGIMINGIKKGFYFNISGVKSKKSMVLASDVAKFILKASYVGGIYNLTDGYNPIFSELSFCIAKQVNKKFLPIIPKFIAIILAKIGDKIGPQFPINSNKLLKITSSLTFNDSKAREAFGWDPTPVLKGFNIHE
jgi:nucleoside-diphosphate-sugar epimerase